MSKMILAAVSTVLTLTLAAHAEERVVCMIAMDPAHRHH